MVTDEFKSLCVFLFIDSFFFLILVVHSFIERQFVVKSFSVQFTSGERQFKKKREREREM